MLWGYKVLRNIGCIFVLGEIDGKFYLVISSLLILLNYNVFLDLYRIFYMFFFYYYILRFDLMVVFNKEIILC